MMHSAMSPTIRCVFRFYCLTHIQLENSAVMSKDLQLVTHLKQGPLPFITSDGEEWREINTPRFRLTEQRAAWRFCSSLGRAIANDGTILQAKKGERVYTSVASYCEGAVGSVTDLALHDLILYTFVGPRPSLKHTGDHINGQRWDNRVENLRWATPEEQIANRTYRKRQFEVNGEKVEHIKDLARTIDEPLHKVQTLVQGTSVGDTITIANREVVVTGLVEKPMKSGIGKVSDGWANLNTPKVVPIRTKVLLKFLGGMQVDDIVQHWATVNSKSKGPIKRSSVIAYLNVAIRESDVDTCRGVAARLGLSSAKCRYDIAVEIANYERQHGKVEMGVWGQVLKCIFEKYTTLENGWETVYACFKTLIKQLDGIDLFGQEGWLDIFKVAALGQ